MPDPDIRVSGDSEPAVALALLQLIMRSEGETARFDRDWILSTYADCLAVVGGAEVEYGDEDEGDEAEDRKE